MLLLSLGPRQKAAVKRLINCPVPVVSANCRLALSSRLQKYRLFTRKEFVILFGRGQDRERDQRGEGYHPVQRERLRTVGCKTVKLQYTSLVSLNCLLPRSAVQYSSTCYLSHEKPGRRSPLLIDQSRFRWSGRKLPAGQCRVTPEPTSDRLLPSFQSLCNGRTSLTFCLYRLVVVIEIDSQKYFRNLFATAERH